MLTLSAADRVEVVAEALSAFVALDAEGFASHLTDDVVLRPSAFISGRTSFYGRSDVIAGIQAIREGFEERGDRFAIVPERFYVDGTDAASVMVLTQVKITRGTGEDFGTEMAYLLTMRGAEIAELAAWSDHREGLSQLEEPVRVERR